ncbi:MAG TPA: hypothetical protein VGM37_02500 [Armatimonadota bacterium]|jgi:hypothetical protein
MSTVYGLLNVSDLSTISQVGQQEIYTAASGILAAHDAELNRALGLFVQPQTTTLYNEIYKLISGGKMQKVNEYGQPMAVKASGQYNVSYPIHDFQDAIAVTRVTRAKMTLREYQRHLDNINDRHINAIRFEVLRALLNKTNQTWKDPQFGDLTLRRLANGDGTVFPPVVGSEAGAEDTHYLVSGYVTANISDVNNPFVTLRAELIEHGQGDMVAFINAAETTKISALTAFVEAPDPFIRAGSSNDAIVQQLANAPGTYLGRVKGSGGAGCHVFEWNQVPAAYILALNLALDQPLKKRVDPETELQGYGLIPGANPQYPLQEAIYGERCGYAVAGRLSAAVMFLDAGGVYNTPAAFA